MSTQHPGLQGASVIVTGGARGQGAIEAEIFAASGAHVVIADVLEEQGNALAAKIVAAGHHAAFVALDVTDADAWQRVVAEAIKPTGRVDALVNNAGIGAVGRLNELDHETFRRVIDVNVYGAMLGINAVTPSMTENGGGSIVNVCSIAGQIGWPSTGYTISKWAMTGLTKTAAFELGPRGIRVNSVHPGIIDDTDFAGGTPSDLSRDYGNATPLGRAGRAEDVAPIVVFLASSLSQYLSGAEISVDGGFVAAGAANAVFGRPVLQAP